MADYRAPVTDALFALRHIGMLDELSKTERYAHADPETVASILSEQGRFMQEVFAPSNAIGDRVGLTWRPDGVDVPAEFIAAYAKYVEAGWQGLNAEVDYGGAGFPEAVTACATEFTIAANASLSMAPLLTTGAIECLQHWGTEEQKETYLRKLVTGEWAGTMNLTEPQAGSDVGLCTTRAVPQGDGSYRISGTKIFISFGEHEMAGNIVHLVLARLPEAPPGTKGISLFLAPKFLPDGTRNPLRCDGIEKKMGIKGSATCVMAFDGATGWLVGEPNRGLQAMFAMMNAARLHVALQGLAHAQNAHRNAVVYAHERLQSRAPVREGKAAADPIVLHPAMRRTLLRQRVLVEGARLIAYEAAHLIDLAEHAGDAAQRERAQEQAALLTPVLKSFLTDNGFALASDALQVFGGHGYTHDWGIEQCLRDARIAMIYEGTNQIQAIDLVVRKLVTDGGRAFAAWLETLAASLPRGARYAQAAAGQLQALAELARDVVAASRDDAELPFRVADDLLRATALALIAHAWARAEAVSARPAHAGDAFHAAKRESAAHCFTHLRPEFEHALAQARAGWLPFAQVALGEMA